MGYLFLDIETFVDEKNMKSGLNPYEKESKVIMINYNYYDKEPLSYEDIKPPTFLKEWESSEKEILTKFYEVIKEMREKHKERKCIPKFIGFNILGFDLPYLFGRMVVNEIDTPDVLHDLLFRKPIKIDLMNVSSVLSDKVPKYNEILPLRQNQANEYFNIPQKTGTGGNLTNFYLAKQYDEIIRYVKEEFTFEALYLLMKEFILENQKQFIIPDFDDRVQIAGT